MKRSRFSAVDINGIIPRGIVRAMAECRAFRHEDVPVKPRFVVLMARDGLKAVELGSILGTSRRCPVCDRMSSGPLESVNLSPRGRNWLFY